MRTLEAKALRRLVVSKRLGESSTKKNKKKKIDLADPDRTSEISDPQDTPTRHPNLEGIRSCYFQLLKHRLWD